MIAFVTSVCKFLHLTIIKSLKNKKIGVPDQGPIVFNDELKKRVESSPSMMREYALQSEVVRENAEKKAEKEKQLKRIAEKK
jgi:hypothetical protein